MDPVSMARAVVAQTSALMQDPKAQEKIEARRSAIAEAIRRVRSDHATGHPTE